MKIECDYDLCVYQKNKSCVLDKVYITSGALCGHCTLLSFEEDFLIAKRAIQLAMLENPDKKFPSEKYFILRALMTDKIDVKEIKE